MAIPIVAIVDQLLPVAKETIEQIIQAANKKIWWDLIILNHNKS